MSIGIYKITSPSGKVYIGQSVNIEDRKITYVYNQCKKQPKIYNSLKKYGWEQHKFEIIEECLIEQLDKCETYWKQYYLDLLGWEKMLFCHLVDGKGGHKSDSTKGKIGISKKGFKFSEESKLKMSKSKKNLKRSEEFKEKMKKPKSEEHKLKISISSKGKKRSEEFKEKMRIIRTNTKRSEESKQKQSRSLTGKKQSEETRLKRSISSKGKERNNEFKINQRYKVPGRSIVQYDKYGKYIKEWFSIMEAERETKVWNTSISSCCKGKVKTAGGYIWKYKN